MLWVVVILHVASIIHEPIGAVLGKTSVAWPGTSNNSVNSTLIPSSWMATSCRSEILYCSPSVEASSTRIVSSRLYSACVTESVTGAGPSVTATVTESWLNANAGAVPSASSFTLTETV